MRIEQKTLWRKDGFIIKITDFCDALIFHGWWRGWGNDTESHLYM